MRNTNSQRRSPALLWSALALILVCSFVALSATAGTCYGTRYDYYDGPDEAEIVGTKVICPGYPTQYDTDIYGNYTETPWYSIEVVNCPCTTIGGGGGGGGGGEDTEDDG